MTKLIGSECKEEMDEDTASSLASKEDIEGLTKFHSFARIAAKKMDADAALAHPEVLKLQARLEDLIVWEIEKVKQSRKGCKTYTYWMASWREAKRAMCTW